MIRTRELFLVCILTSCFTAACDDDREPAECEQGYTGCASATTKEWCVDRTLMTESCPPNEICKEASCVPRCDLPTEIVLAGSSELDETDCSLLDSSTACGENYYRCGDESSISITMPVSKEATHIQLGLMMHDTERIWIDPVECDAQSGFDTGNIQDFEITVDGNAIPYAYVAPCEYALSETSVADAGGQSVAADGEVKLMMLTPSNGFNGNCTAKFTMFKSEFVKVKLWSCYASMDAE
jgi:hypothetical protein